MPDAEETTYIVASVGIPAAIAYTGTGDPTNALIVGALAGTGWGVFKLTPERKGFAGMFDLPIYLGVAGIAAGGYYYYTTGNAMRAALIAVSPAASTFGILFLKSK